jgi:mono/diheme cytochrome c family protein
MNWKISTALLSAALVCSAPVAFGAGAAELYAKHCKSCHGADGKGQTAMGKKSKAKDYSTAEGQKWSDAEGVKAILDGKDKMKGYKDKGITEADAKALVAYIRAFKK